MSIADPGRTGKRQEGLKAATGAPPRKSVLARIAEKKLDQHPLTTSTLDNIPAIAETDTFTVAQTGELILDDLAPLPLAPEIDVHQGELDLQSAKSQHLFLVPQEVRPAEIEALAVSVWNQSGWLSPGHLRLLEGATLEGPWQLGDQTEQALGLPSHLRDYQVYTLMTPPVRGNAPSSEVQQYSEMARAFPDGMPVGLEERVLGVLQQMARRLGGALRVTGGYVLEPDPESSVNLRLYASTWLSPEESLALLSPALPGLREPGPPPETEGAPYALIAPSGSRSQVLFGVRTEIYTPRALRWEIWAKERVFLYEIIWGMPEDLHTLDAKPTRAGRLERRRGAESVETAAAILTKTLNTPEKGGAAVIDEDGFLVDPGEPPQEEASPRP